MKSKNQSLRFFQDNLYFRFCWLVMPLYAKLLISNKEYKDGAFIAKEMVMLNVAKSFT